MTVRARHVLILSLLLVAACSEKQLLPTYDLSGNTMGTTFNVTVVAPPADFDFEALQTRITDRLEHIENIASTYRSDSELSRFNALSSTDWERVVPEFCRMIVAANEISFMTQGAFDITVGPLVNLWGFGPENQENRFPSDDEIAAAVEEACVLACNASPYGQDPVNPFHITGVDLEEGDIAWARQQLLGLHLIEPEEVPLDAA